MYRQAQASQPIAQQAQEHEYQPEPEPPTQKGGRIQELPVTLPPIASPAQETVARIRNMPVGDIDEAPIEKRQVLKGYEIEENRYVTFEPHELAAIRPRTSTELAIAEFVLLEEIDPIFFETSYYAMPDRGGEKPYALLFRALAETGYAALGSLAMHGREHATVIRAGKRGLILHTLFYANEVRADEEYQSDATLVSAKELELAKLFVKALAGKFEPAKLKDAFEERLQKLIESRAETAIDAYHEGEVTRRAPVVDIMEALKKSLEMARKPPKSERAATKSAKRRERRS